MHFDEKSKSESPSVVINSLRPHELYSPWNCPFQNTGLGSLSLLQRVFPTQESNPDLSHCRQILYQLSHKGSPTMLKWVAYSSPVDLSHPGIKPGSLALQMDSLPTELSEKSKQNNINNKWNPALNETSNVACQCRRCRKLCN